MGIKMNQFVLSKSGNWLAGLSALALIILIISVIIGAIFIVADIYTWLIVAKYRQLNRKQSSIGLTAEEVAKKMLEQEGLPDIHVKKCGFFRALLYGNSYSYRKKTIFLRGNIYGKNSLTGVATASRLVGLAVQDRDKEPKFLFVARALPFVQFAPFMVLPLVLLGFLLDFVVFSTSVPFLITLILLGASLVYLLVAFVFTLLNVGVQKTAIIVAKDILKNGGEYVTQDEYDSVCKLYNYYLTKYVLDFITNTLELIKLIFQIIYTALKAVGKIKK